MELTDRRPASGLDRPATSARLFALDWMRGLVMVLMTIDHAGDAFDAGHIYTDGAWRFTPGTPLPAAEFFNRWITHLCAPTFVFLAGVSLALSVHRRVTRNESPTRIDRHLLVRGLILVALEPVWMTWGLFTDPSVAFRIVLLQVLFVIGTGMVCMIALRRLPTAALVGLGALLAVGSEALDDRLTAWLGGKPQVLQALLSSGPNAHGVYPLYPLLPWLSVMLFGWSFGRVLLGARGASFPERLLGAAAGLALATFAVVRGLNGYGNAGLPRYGNDLVQWLHVSKYPPSLSFLSLELGLMAILLAGFFALGRTRHAPRALVRLRTLGQTALFYYVLHVHLLMVAALLLGAPPRFGLAARYAATAAVVGALYPVCAWYGRYKRRRNGGWSQYL